MTIKNSIMQFLGFLMQTIPIAILCLVPFRDEALRVSRRRFTVLFCLGLIVSAVGFTCLLCFIYLPDGAHNTLIVRSANLYMAVNILVFAIVFFWEVRAAMAKKILVFMMMIHYAAITYVLCGIIRGMLAEDVAEMPKVLLVYARVDVFTYAGIFVITAPVVCLFFKKVLRIDLDLMEDASLRRSCIYVGGAIFLFCISVFALNMFGFYYGYFYGPMLFFMLSAILTDAFLYYVLFSEFRLAQKNQRLEEQLRSFDEQYKEISSHIEEARRLRHDIRHHLNYISVMNSRGEQKELEQYLESYEASCRELEQMPLSGYHAFDNIFQYYIERAKENEIEIKMQIGRLNHTPGFDVIDMTVLLGNLMDNAIEACCRLPHTSSRWIHVWAKQEDVQFLISIENSCDRTENDQPDFTDGAGFISSKHASNHGQGLKSIRLIAEKYGGNAEFRKADEIFTARVVLNIL